MITKTFETEAEAIEFLTEDKQDECVVALTNRFYAAREEGLDLQLASEKAQLLHTHLDHGHGLDVPADFPFTTDAEAEASLSESLLSKNDDGHAQERLDLTLSIFRRFRSWGVNILYAGSTAAFVAEYEWYKIKANDLDESYARSVIAGIKNDRVRGLTQKAFDEVLAETGIVLLALEAAKTAASLEEILGAILNGKRN